MSQTNEVKPTKRPRARRSPEMIAEFIWEAEKKGNAAEVCRREGISPNLFYRWRQKFKEGGIAGIKAIKRGRKAVDHDKQRLEAENRRLTEALCEASIELVLLKKSVSSGYMDR